MFGKRGVHQQIHPDGYLRLLCDKIRREWVIKQLMLIPEKNASETR